jgi:peptidoglycan-associated lipoprotein
MRIGINTQIILLLSIAAVSLAQAAAQAAEKPLRSELALDYSYVRSNAPPAGCTCFNLNGGSATFAWPIGHDGFELAGDVTVAHGGGIASNTYSLTLSAYTAGARYRIEPKQSSFEPFGQVLVGLAHSSGTLVQGLTPATANAGAAFAANLGGGLDLRATRQFSVRLIEANYLLTTIDNGVNNHQNNLRLSAGVVLHF